MRESKIRAALRFFLTVFIGVAINIAIAEEMRRREISCGAYFICKTHDFLLL